MCGFDFLRPKSNIPLVLSLQHPGFRCVLCIQVLDPEDHSSLFAAKTLLSHRAFRWKDFVVKKWPAVNEPSRMHTNAKRVPLHDDRPYRNIRELDAGLLGVAVHEVQPW